jgi:hypothetical protein
MRLLFSEFVERNVFASTDWVEADQSGQAKYQQSALQSRPFADYMTETFVFFQVNSTFTRQIYFV